MHFVDLRELDDQRVIEADVCIVGSGPAGLSIAQELSKSGLHVWIAESGGLQPEPDTQALYDVENVGTPRCMPQDRVRQRIYGGSSHTWSGRNATFDHTDFSKRSWVPYSGWPISRDDFDPFLERARPYLRVGPNCYDERLWPLLRAPRPTPPLNAEHLKPAFWQFCADGQPVRFAATVLTDSAPNVKTLLHANVTQINVNADSSRVESVELSTLEGKHARIVAKMVVLCCGGIENARLLLASNRVMRQGVGNQNDTVGRFLMDHPGSVIGSFDPRQSSGVQDRFGSYWLDDEYGRHRVLHGVALSPQLQEKEGLVNCAAFLEEYVAVDDPWRTMKRFVNTMSGGTSSDDSEDATMFWRSDVPSGGSTGPVRDAMGILAHSPSIAQSLYRRYVKHRPPLTRNAQVDLYSLAEQVPDPESRVTLSERKDALGMPLARVTWKINLQEVRSLRRLVSLIGQEFKRIGLAPPTPSPWLSADDPSQWQFTDRAHPTGATRMSLNPKEGVVDANCMVHGVEGLFIAGSSVFPTAGHANPTLMIVAMAVRLADRLKSSHRP